MYRSQADDVGAERKDLGGLVPRRRAEIEHSHSRLDFEQRHDRLRTGILLAAGVGIDRGFGLFESGAGDRGGCLLAILLLPAFEHPGGDAEFGGLIRPR